MPIICIALLFLLPALITWRKERRLRKLANSRYQLTRSVTEMERLMLSGDLKLGDVSHDILFRHMQRVQNSNVYEVDWKPSDTSTPLRVSYMFFICSFCTGACDVCSYRFYARFQFYGLSRRLSVGSKEYSKRAA